MLIPLLRFVGKVGEYSVKIISVSLTILDFLWNNTGLKEAWEDYNFDRPIEYRKKPLIQAIQDKDLNKIKFLLTLRSTKINQTTLDGDPALSHTVERFDLPKVSLLLNEKAKIRNFHCIHRFIVTIQQVGISSCLHLFSASKSLISRCRGIAEIFLFSLFSHMVWFPPSRFLMQPCFLKCLSRTESFII